jgi:hypothetical protein
VSLTGLLWNGVRAYDWFMDEKLGFAHLLYDENEVDKVGGKRRDVRNDGYNFTAQAVQKLLQFGLIGGHANVEVMNSILHLVISL